MHTASSHSRRRRLQNGFTLIELVVVIIVMGILAAVITMGGTPLFSSRSIHADTLKSHIRYAQSQAMKTKQTWGIAWNADDYWLFNGTDATSGNASPLPGEETSLVNLAGRKVSISPAPYVLAFDEAGRPHTDAALTTSLAADTTVTITATDDATVSKSFTITTETGYLQ